MNSLLEVIQMYSWSKTKSRTKKRQKKYPFSRAIQRLSQLARQGLVCNLNSTKQTKLLRNAKISWWVPWKWSRLESLRLIIKVTKVQSTCPLKAIHSITCLSTAFITCQKPATNDLEPAYYFWKFISQLYSFNRFKILSKKIKWKNFQYFDL
jgi:hypothetical protein